MIIDIEKIDEQKMSSSYPARYIGWNSTEIHEITQQIQRRFYGTTDDYRLELLDEKGDFNYLIFRGIPNIISTAKSFLFNPQQGTLLVMVCGIAYRYHTLEHHLYPNTPFDQLALNTVDRIRSHYFKSVEIPEKNVIITVDATGVSLINWDGVIKQMPSPDPCCEDASFLKVTPSEVIIQACSGSNKLVIKLE